MAHLITGYAGEEHIGSKDQGSFNAALFGAGQYVMEIGNELEATITSNNNVRISDGDLLMNGRHIRIETDMYEDVLIETGTAGTNRNDLIVMRYEKDASTGIEVAKLEVVKGTESEGIAVDSAINENNILEGASVSQMPLYRVRVQGVVLQAVEPMFKKIPTYARLAERYKQEFVESCQTHLDSLNILDSVEAVDANSEANQLAGGLAIKEMHQEMKRVESYTILTSDWVDKTTYAMVTKAFSGVKTSDYPMASMISADITAPTEVEIENEKLLLGVKSTEDGSITFYAKEIPSEQVTIEVRL